ncbi:PepSY-like domain-containing protein [Paraflavitalea speifideaquila]|uniref:PepSY-like domain-containing protein n=1 Tax=Paraflavitalea speifideaquila TaxID=3076558 RepID=UPI0028EAA293|nr:PepSY-like domain-containing protein [Paraflavitalea speifideiaquila]
MKRIIPSLLIVLSLVLTNNVLAQVRSVPASVTEAFKSKYPSASNVAWKDKLSGFVAAFDHDGHHYEARFNNKAVWQYTEEAVGESGLPADVKDGFNKSKWAEWKVGGVTKIDLPDNKTQYRVLAVKSDLQKKNLLFNSEGRLLKENITL